MKKIIVIEDIKSDQKKIEAVLLELGYKVLNVFSYGEEELLSITENQKLNKNGKEEYAVSSAKNINEIKRVKSIIKDLHKIAVSFKELKTEKEICQSTIRAAENILDFNLCNILLVKKENLIPMASSSNYKQEKRSIFDKSIAAKTYKEGKSFIIKDLQNNSDAAEIENIYKSAISISIGNYGVFQAAAPQKDAFSEKDLELAEILISHVKAALERVYAHQKTIKQKAYFEQLFNNSPEAIVLLDTKHRVMKTNKKFESLFGFKQSELLNKNLDDFIVPVEMFKIGTNYTKKVINGEKVEGEIIRKTKDGKDLYVSMQGFPIRLANGQIGIYALYRDITARKKREKEIEYLSFHDPLTGLYNRRYFENELKRLESFRKHPIAIIIGDLDGLKVVNDNYGHKKGDDYIINSAEILKSTARSEDIIARIGGDEFAIILPNTDYNQAEKFCKRVQENFKELNKKQKMVKPLSLSLGFEVMKDSNQDLDKVFNSADQKMYINKGRK